MITGINHITLSVRDIDEAFLFYTDILGLKPVMKSRKSCYFLAGDLWIACVQETIEQERILYTHIAWQCSEEFLQEFKNRMKTHSIRQWQENTSEGDSVYFCDPSGNRLELHCSGINERIAHGKKHWEDIIWYV